MNKQLDELRKFLDSPEGLESMKKFADELDRQHKHQDRWVEKLKSRYGNNIDEILEKLMNKYYSDEYRDREYKIGFEPREPLLWLVWEYAAKYCEECNEEKYFNTFTGAAYYIGSYVIQIMYGQGSVLRIDKREDNEI